MLRKNGMLYIRGFSDSMKPSKSGDGPLRLTRQDILTKFSNDFVTVKLYKYKNLPPPERFKKEQIWWSYIGKLK